MKMSRGTVSEDSVKIFRCLLLLPYPLSWLHWQWRKLHLFWCYLLLAYLFCLLLFLFFFFSSWTLVRWLFNNLFQSVSGNWSWADCCEIPWVFLFPLKKLQDICWWRSETIYGNSVCASCSLAGCLFSCSGNFTAFMKYNNCLSTWFFFDLWSVLGEHLKSF